jgi:hypothetical protein
MSAQHRDKSAVSADEYSNDFVCKRTYDMENDRITEEIVQKEGSIQFTTRECLKSLTSSDDINLKHEFDTLIRAEEQLKKQIQHDDKQFWEFIDKKKAFEYDFVYRPA